MPSSGPWRSVARAATHLDPDRRPQSIDELLQLIDDELDDPPLDAATEGEALLARVEKKDDARNSARELWRLAARSDNDYDLFVEALAKLPAQHVRRLAGEHPQEAAAIVAAWHVLLDGSGERFLSFGLANQIVLLLLEVCRVASEVDNWGLMEDAADVMFEWDAAWDQWNARDAVISWLRSLEGESARVAGAALRRNREGRTHFDHLADDRRADRRVRAGAAARD